MPQVLEATPPDAGRHREAAGGKSEGGGGRTHDPQIKSLPVADRNQLPDNMLRQHELSNRTASVPTDPLVAALAALAALTPDQRAALAALLSATAPTGATPAPTLPAPRPTIADDVLPWERPEAQESH